MEQPTQSTKESKRQYLDAISEATDWFQLISKANHSTSNPSLCLNHQCQRSWSWKVLRRPPRPSNINTKKGCHFVTRDWNAKVGIQEIPGVTGKFGFGVRNEAGQRLREFCQENALVIANTLFLQHKRRLYTWTSPNGQHQNQITLIIFFAAKYGSAIYSQQKQDWELTVAQIMTSLFPNSDLNWRKWGKPLDHSGMT